MQKFIPKIDAEKEFKSTPKLATKVPKVGPWGVRRASLRRRRFAIWLLLSETPDTGRCRRIVVRGDRRQLEILAVEAIIFIHETGGRWQKQASLALKRSFKKGMQNLMPKKL